MKQICFMLGALVSMSACVTEDVPSDEQVVGEEVALRGGNDFLPNNFPILNQFGLNATWSVDNGVDLDSAFFEDFGTNQRTCGSCHKATEGWSISTPHLNILFWLTGGNDPIFRTNDGSNSPNADVSNVLKRRQAYSMLLDHGTIRVGIPMPATRDFELDAVDDPYGFASAAELSMFRRPLPASNLIGLTSVMWDGRETNAVLSTALANQANGATLGHAAALAPLSQEEREAIVDFELGLFNAQTHVIGAGSTGAQGGGGGPEELASQDVVAARRWDIFDSWQNSNNPRRRQIWRGQELFNTRTHVAGNPNFTCTNCHTTKNFGTDTQGRFFNVLNPNNKPLRRTADQPLYTFRYTGPTAGTLVNGQTVQTTDPGRALITGRFADMNRFKVPGIRGLAARAPYFRDGSARTLKQLVKTYEERIDFVFTDAEEDDLVAFLSAL